MRISTQTQFAIERLGVTETFRVLKEAGFDAYDYTILDASAENPLYGDDWQSHIAEVRAAAQAVGLPCNQAHAPHPTSQPDLPKYADYNARIFDVTVRCIEAAAMLGANAIVVHPVQHMVYREHAEELFRLNMDFYRALAPYAKRAGIRIALENMWQRNGQGVIVDSTCGQPAEFIRYFDTLADDCFTCCLDIGHCFLCGHDPAAAIREMGAGRIGALHVHDNDGKDDLHLLPHLGRINWSSVAAALADVGYRGDFTYEAYGFIKKMPAAAMPAAYRLMADVARGMK